jgi:hypothetical protein
MCSGCHCEQEFLGESGSHWRVIKASAVALPAIAMEGGDWSRQARVLFRRSRIPRQVHMVNGSSGVKGRQNIPQLADMFWVYAARVVLFERPFQSPVANYPYHSETEPATWRMSITMLARLLLPATLG